MALAAPFDQAVAAHLLELSLRGGARPALAPAPVPAVELAREDTIASRTHRSEVARFLVHVLLASPGRVVDVQAQLEAILDEHVSLWTPAIATTSREALLAALRDADDAVDGMAVAIMGECVSGPTSWIEWRAEGTFRNPGFLNDDVLVEPSGVRVRSCGVLVLDFSRERVRGIRCYYDGLALVGQVLTRPPVPT